MSNFFSKPSKEQQNIEDEPSGEAGDPEDLTDSNDKSMYNDEVALKFLGETAHEQDQIKKEQQKQLLLSLKDAILEDICDFEEPDTQMKKIPIDPIHLEKEAENHEEILNNEFQMDYQLDREDTEPQYFLLVEEMTIFEKMETYQDKYPLLFLRKKIWYVQQLISHICLKIITHWFFDTIALIVIISNSFVLAMDDPTTDSTTPTVDLLDWIFLCLYTAEMSLKILGFGFFLSKNAYLRDYWNVLDFIIVFSAWLPKFQEGQGSSGLNSLRVLRVLRPLRTISTIKALKVILTSLFSAIRLLLDSLIILMFFFMIFAIGGLQLMMGFLKRRCFDPATGISISDDNDNVKFCSSDDACIQYQEKPGNPLICGKMVNNPNFGLINFDTFGWSFLQVFQCVTMEGWSTTMHWIMDAFTPYAVIYFIFIIFMGTFFLMNLTLAIITTNFDQAQKEASNTIISDSSIQQAKLLAEKEGKHDLKKSIEWGIYKSNKERYMKLERFKSQLSQFNSLGECEPNLEYKTTIVKLKNEEEETVNQQIDSAKSNQNQVPPDQLQRLMNLRKSRMSVGQTANLSRKQSIFNVYDQSENPEEYGSFSLQNGMTLQTQIIPKPKVSVGFNSQSRRIMPFQDNGLSAIKEEKPRKRLSLPKINKISMSTIQSQIGKPIKINIVEEKSFQSNSSTKNKKAICFEGILQQKEKQQQKQEVQTSKKNISLSRNQSQLQEADNEDNSRSSSTSNQSFSDDSDDKMDQEDEFIQDLKVANRNKPNALENAESQYNRQNEMNILVLKSSKNHTKHSPKPQQSDQNLIGEKQTDIVENLDLTPSVSKKSSINLSQSESGTDRSSFDINNPHIKNIQMLDDEDFRNQQQNNFRVLHKDLGIKRETLVQKNNTIKNRVMTRRQSRRKTKLRRTDNRLGGLNTMILNQNTNGKDDQDEEEKAQILRQLYNSKYMKAIINNMIEMYKVDEDDGQIPYDSIQDVLPSLQQKAEQEKENWAKQKMISKQFKIKYRVEDKKIKKIIERGNAQTRYKEYKRKKFQQFVNFISAKSKKDEAVSYARFAQVFQIEPQENPNANQSSQKTPQQTIIKPNLSNSFYPSNFQSTIYDKDNSVSTALGSKIKKKKKKKAKDNNDKEKEQYPQELKFVQEIYFPQDVFYLDYHDKNSKKKRKKKQQQEKTQETQQDLDQKDKQKIAQETQPEKKEEEKKDDDKEKEKKKKDGDSDETDEEEIPKNLKDEYDWRRQRDINLHEDEFSVADVNIDWSGEDVLSIYPQYLQVDWKTLVHFGRILQGINWTNKDYEIWEGGIYGLFLAFRRQVRDFALGKWFDTFIMLSVFGNTIILAMDGLVSNSGSHVLNTFNFAFTIIFTIDMGLKMFGQGVVEYLKDKMCVFDCIIVSLSLVELFIFGSGGSAISAFRSVRIFRTFRVLRVTRLVRSLQYMQVIMRVISSTLEEFMYIFLLLILFNYIYALVGMQLFGGKFNMSDLPTRMTFDDFFSAYISVFQIMTMENWNDLLTTCLRSTANPILSLLFLISWIFMGNYVLLNLFLAILLNGFGGEQDNEMLQDGIEIAPDINLNHGTQSLAQTQATSNLSGNLILSQIPGFQSSEKKEGRQSQFVKAVDQQVQNEKQKQQDELDNIDGIDDDELRVKPQKKKFVWFEGISCQNSWFIFSQTNYLRKFAYLTVKHEQFETVILIAIIVSSLKLAFDTYTDDKDPSQAGIISISSDIDMVFTIFFAMECLLKQIAFGFILDDNSYLRETWSQLDYFIVIASLIDLSLTGVNLQFVKILRLLRTLRPLRFISHNKNMKLVVTALLESASGIINVLIVVLLIWLMFAIFGISMMKNKVHYCDFSSANDKAANATIYGVSRKDCLHYYQGTWANHDLNFDNIFSGIITLFVLSTMEGWPNYIFDFVDADNIADDGENLGPEEGGNKLFMLYFIVFILVGTLFLVNLFIGVVQLNYLLADKAAKSKFLTENQSKWIEVQKLIVESKPDYASIKPPENYLRQKIWYFCEGPILDTFVMTCIILNIITMAMAYETSPEYYDTIVKQVNLGFTSVFMAECVLKLFAYGFKGYFYSGWNRFDFFVVCTSIVDLVLDQMGSSTTSFLKIGPQLGRIFRVLRVSRLLRLVKSFQGLQKLIQVAIYSLPSLMNVTALLLLVFFIFSILGVFLFSSVKQLYFDQQFRAGQMIGTDINFNNFHQAFLLLFVCSTGENWFIIMFDVMKGISGQAVWFFILFVVLIQIIMINLFILIILQQFEENFINEKNPLTNFQEHEGDFKQLWVKYTIQQNGIKMHEKQLVDFFFDLKKPLGLGGNQQLKDLMEQVKEKNNFDSVTEKSKISSNKQILKRQGAKCLMNMQIYPDYDGFTYYNELLYYLYKNHMQDDIDEIDPQKSDPKTIMIAQDIIEDEQKITKRKIDRIKSKRHHIRPTNPMVKLLFVNMCLKTWLNYAIIKLQKMQSMYDQGQEIKIQNQYQFSSSETDSQQENTKQMDNNGQEIKMDKTSNIISREHMHHQKQNKNGINQQNFIKCPDTHIYKQELDDLDQINQKSSEENSVTSQHSGDDKQAKRKMTRRKTKQVTKAIKPRFSVQNSLESRFNRNNSEENYDNFSKKHNNYLEKGDSNVSNIDMVQNLNTQSPLNKKIISFQDENIGNQESETINIKQNPMRQNSKKSNMVSSQKSKHILDDPNLFNFNIKEQEQDQEDDEDDYVKKKK